MGGGGNNQKVTNLKDLVLFIHKDNLAVNTGFNWCQFYEGQTPQRAIRASLNIFKPNTKYVIRFKLTSNADITITGYHNIFVDDGTRTTTMPKSTSKIIELHVTTVDETQFGQFNSYNADLVWCPWQPITSISELIIMEESKYDSSITYKEFDGSLIAVPDIHLKYSKYGTDYVFFNTTTRKWCKCDVVGESGLLLKKPVVTELSQTQHNMLTSISFLLSEDLSDYTVEMVGCDGINPYEIFKFEEAEACYISAYHTKGNQIYDEFDLPVTIHAINNQFTESQSETECYENVVNDITCLGFDTVQMHLYGSDWFEPDMTTVKPFANYFIDELNRYKRYGKRVIIKFYGLYNYWRVDDTAAYATGKWWGESSDEYREKMLAFQKFIIKKFKDDPFIIGFSIANEPVNSGLVSATHAIYGEYINGLIDYININAPKKLVFIETTSGGVILTKPNLVYEWHMYSPHFFTHMLTGSNNEYVKYPSPNIGFRTGSWLAGTYKGESKTFYGNNWTGEWQEVSYQYLTIDNPLINTASFTFHTRNFGPDTKIVIDNPVVQFFDSEKNLTREFTLDIDTLFNMKETNPKSANVYTVVDGEAIDGTGAYVVTGLTTTDDYKLAYGNPTEYLNGNCFMFVPLENEKYVTMKCKVKITNVYNSSTNFYITGACNKYPFVAPFDRNFISKYLDFRIDSIRTNTCSLPLYIGEVGLDAEKSCYLNYYTYNYQRRHLNGELFAADMLRELGERNLSFAWFSYNTSGFGLHVASSVNDLKTSTNGNSRLWETVRASMTNRFDEEKLYWDEVQGTITENIYNTKIKPYR